MVALPEEIKDKVRWHLGFVYDAVDPAWDSALEFRMDNLRNNYEATQVQTLTTKCEYAFNRQFVDDQSTGIAQSTIIVGDINRSETVNVAEARRQRQRAYVDACKLLARKLAVPYMGHEEGSLPSSSRSYQFRPLGPADTSVGSKLLLAGWFY
jgi:hypothetical protein